MKLRENENTFALKKNTFSIKKNTFSIIRKTRSILREREGERENVTTLMCRG